MCRVRSCFRPDHLEPVTNLENVRRGMRPKLTLDEAKAIKQAKGRRADIAAKYSVSVATVKAIRSGRNWKDA